MGNANCIVKNRTGHAVLVRTYNHFDVINMVPCHSLLILSGQQRSVEALPDHRGLKLSVEGNGMILPIGVVVTGDTITISDLEGGTPVVETITDGCSHCFVSNESDSAIIVKTYVHGEVFNLIPYATYLVEANTKRRVESMFSPKGVKVKGEDGQGVVSKVCLVNNGEVLVVKGPISANNVLGQ